jgi:monoamine oxidase
MDQQDNFDAIIIGAGAAGLVAARDLVRAEKRVAVLEARGRVGGRVFTYRDPAVTVPIELGAEFLHGKTAETDAIMDEAGLTAVDVVGEHWRAEHGRLRPVGDFFAKVDKVLSKLDEHRTPDRTFAEFLAEREARAKKPGKGAEARRLAMEFVQGFHAADASRVSERWLAKGGDPGESPEEARMGRVLEGYDRVIAWLAREVFDAIELNTIVQRIDWERGHVRVTARTADGATREFVARTAIVTVPIGVLAESGGDGAITFAPEVPALREAATQLVMGPVMRMVFAFADRFWEHGIRAASGTYDLSSLSFIHSPGSAVPVWWTMAPVRAGVLVAWVGGPNSRDLLAQSHDEIVSVALHDLADHLGITSERLRTLSRGAWMHDWSSDPYARGAYSYAVAGGSGAPRKLARPVEQTLFFAGEATDTEGRTGTVEGALTTGRRAARGVIHALS